jgi:hypothetical protein
MDSTSPLLEGHGWSQRLGCPWDGHASTHSCVPSYQYNSNSSLGCETSLYKNLEQQLHTWTTESLLGYPRTSCHGRQPSCSSMESKTGKWSSTLSQTARGWWTRPLSGCKGGIWATNNTAGGMAWSPHGDSHQWPIC